MSTSWIYILVFTTFVFASLNSQAQIEITGISRASNWSIADNKESATIWGGLAGATNIEGCSSTSTTATCNNCASAPSGTELACNERRIHQSLILKIDFKVTDDISGDATLELNSETNGFSAGSDLQNNSSSTNMSQNNTGSVFVDWNDICNVAGDSTCNSAGSASAVLAVGNFTTRLGVTDDATMDSTNSVEVQIFVHFPPTSTGDINILDCDDTTATGVCDFYAYPGDQKATIEDFFTTADWPTSNSVSVQAVRVFASTTSFADADYGAEIYADLAVDSDGSVDPNIIDGLDNNTTYFLRPAIVDEAFNVAYLADTSFITTKYAGCGTPDDFTCQMMATPLAVYGVLTEDLNCFISTAAFGSHLASEVNTFRAFRNRFMMDHKLGIQFRKAYYKFGPMAARFINKHSWTKPVVRAALYPALWYSEASLKYGIQKANLMFALSFSGLFGILILGLIGFRRWSYVKA